ncbi:MAG TPA: LOG family protein, partial [Xanthobacteraceae bacterium]|nr:LOG family protein [Xanthobacteraceae bacterium]
ERKRVMFERADAFVALPGGVGTLEELVEQLTWAQLGRHRKPILILNIANFWEPLCQLLDQMERLDFIRAGLPVKLLVAKHVEEILPKLLEAARSVSEAEKKMTSVAAARM